MAGFATYGKSFALGTSSAQLSLGLGANETLQITSALAVDTSGAGRVVHLNLAHDGGAAAAANAIESGLTVGANDKSGTGLTGQNVIPGAKVYGYADAAGVTLQVSGLITTQAARVY